MNKDDVLRITNEMTFGLAPAWNPVILEFAARLEAEWMKDAELAKQEPVFKVGFGWLKTKRGNITPCQNGTLLYTRPAPIPEGMVLVPEKLIEGIKARRALRGFYMPEDCEDLIAAAQGEK
jgi:hypothetical protein